MMIFFNDVPTTLPYDNMTVEQFVVWKNLNLSGTAIAINDKLIKRDNWAVTTLHDLDRVMAISAAYGG